MPTTHRFEVLDGLRGVAALSVMLMHDRAGHLANSDLAVDMFFLLSGFVIAYSYRQRLAAGMGVGRFAWRRFVRLYPMLLFGATLGLLAFLLVPAQYPHTADGGTLIGLYLRALLLIPVIHRGPLGIETFPLDTPMWSLCFEVAANLLYGLLAPRLSARVLAGVVGVAILGVLAGGFPGGFETPNLWLGIPRTVAGFFGGVLLHELWRAGRLPRWRAGLAPLAVALLALFALPPPVGAALYLPALAWLTLVMILGINARPARRETVACVALGALSYPLYLVHRPLNALLRGALAAAGANGRLAGFVFAHGTASALATAGPIVLLSYAVLAGYDAPLRRLLSAAGARGAAMSPPPTSAAPR